MPILFLAAALILGLIMLPFGLPGTLVIFGAVLCFKLLVPAGAIGWTTVAIVAALLIVGEVLEWSLTARFARRYGGSKRAGWGAMIGGMIGAFVGVPVPIVGSIVGAFAGAFVGALAAELTAGTGGGTATRVAWGALIGRVTAAAVKIAIGLVMAVLALGVAILGGR